MRQIGPHVCGCGKDFASAKAIVDHVKMKHQGKEPAAVACPYCGKASRFMRSSASIYSGVDYGPVWACLPCEAWVGVHPGTAVPLGRLANKELRVAKSQVHRDFDPIWKRGYAPRRQAYAQLAGMLGIPSAQCHVGLFDVELCKRALAACQILGPRLKAQALAARTDQAA